MKKSLFYLFSALILFNVSCTEETAVVEENEITSEDAKLAIQNMSNDMSLDIVEITQSEGIEGLRSLFNLVAIADPFGGRKEIDHSEYKALLKDKAKIFRSIFSPQKSITGRVEEGFDFEANKGVYDWNFFEERFVKTGLSNSIILNFPTEGSTILNATLEISNYEEVMFIDDIENYYLPTILVGSLTMDDELIIDLDLTISYNDYGDPLTGDVYLYLMPFTFNLSFDDSGSTAATLMASITKGEETIIAVDVELLFQDTQKEEFLSLEGFVQYRDLKVSGSIQNVESDDPNDYVDLSIYIDNQLLGVIVFELDSDEMMGDEMEYYAYVKYGDGSMERVEDVFEPFMMEMEDFMDDMESWGSEGG